MNELSVKRIDIQDNRLEIEIIASGEWGRYINSQVFWCEYNMEIKGLPDSLAVVPLLGNILPIAWVHNLVIHVGTIDKSFYSYLPMVMEGYVKMYPEMKFSDNLIADMVEENSAAGTNERKEVCFFSGGVDAYYTFLRHMDEASALATVWGSDIALDDLVGWKNVEDAVTAVCEKYKKDKYIIKSNFREFINTKNLSDDLKHPGWSWWHEFQHGMGLITLMAPAAYEEKVRKLYIASSYTADIQNLTCASDPSIDNFVRFSDCEVVHDGFEANRQEKIKQIVNYSKESHDRIDLRVCWVSRGGRNCCVCEKCCRTMAAILLEDGEPCEFGFEGKDASSAAIARNMRYRNSGLARDWDLLHAAFQNKYTLESVPAEWRWFYRGGTYSINHNFLFSMRRFFTDLKLRVKCRLEKGVR